MKNLDRIANVAITVAVAIFITLVVRGEFFRRTAAPAHSPSALVGKTIQLPGVAFPAQRLSLVPQSGGYWQCNSGPMGQCTGAIFQYMNQCVGSCPHQGSDVELCYEMVSLQGGQWLAAPLCGSYPSSGANCIQQCMYVAENMLEGCESSNCTWISN